MRREGGVITAAMLHMQDQGQIQDLGLEIGILLVRSQDPEDVFRCGKFFFGIVYFPKREYNE